MLRYPILLLPRTNSLPSHEIQKRLEAFLEACRKAKHPEDVDTRSEEKKDEGDLGWIEKEDDRQPTYALSHNDRKKIQRRVALMMAARERSGGLSHLRREDRDRLKQLEAGVELVRIPNEHRADEIAAEIHGEYPWMQEPSTIVWEAMRRSVREGWPGLRLPPMLLVGPPGIGKTTWARHLCAAIRMPTLEADATSENASFGVVGTQRGWGSATPGRLVNAIFTNQIGNPTVIIDEIEKTGSVVSTSGQSYSLCNALLPLLEPSTAQRWSCPYYQVPFDFSLVSWILTVNSIGTLPEPLLSRCPPIHLDQISATHLSGFADRIGRKRGVSSAGREGILDLISRFAARGRGLSLRNVIRMIDRAAALENRPRLH